MLEEDYYYRRRTTNLNLNNFEEIKVIKPKNLYNTKKKTFFMDTDQETFEDINDLVKEGKNQGEKTHWYYGDLDQRIKKAGKKDKANFEHLHINNVNNSYIKELGMSSAGQNKHDLNCLKPEGKKDYEKIDYDVESKEKTPAQRWDIKRKRNVYVGDCMDNLKLIWIMTLLMLWILQRWDTFSGWQMECEKDKSYHYWKCMEATRECSEKFKTSKHFYCKDVDKWLLNDNFCFENKSICKSKTDFECLDMHFTSRINTFSEEWKECMFSNHNGGRMCQSSLKNEENSYDDCEFGVKMFIFVFFIQDFLIDRVIESIETWLKKTEQDCCKFDERMMSISLLKILLVFGQLVFWSMYLWQRSQWGTDDALDFVYVLQFIGCKTIVCDFGKVFRSHKLNKEYMKNRRLRPVEDEEMYTHWERQSVRWKIIAQIILVPIWAMFLVVYFSQYPENHLIDIMYFAVTPFDELFKAPATKAVVEQLNGIMINTTRKSFKYRNVVKIVFTVALLGNIQMILTQLTLIILFVVKIGQKDLFLMDYSAPYPIILNDVTQILFFGFDAVESGFQIYILYFLSAHSYMIANDMIIRMDEAKQPEDFMAHDCLLNKKENHKLANPVVWKYEIEFRKIGHVHEQPVTEKFVRQQGRKLSYNY